MLLSIENPPPDHDVPSSQFSRLDSASHDLTPTITPPSPSSSSTSSPSKQPDLPNPPLHPQHPFPSFSIRDYVFTTRSKDIETNWPFSSKSLQLCLKYGLKDVLPPFQSLDIVKNQSFGICTAGSTVVEKQKTHKFVNKSAENGGVVEAADSIPLNTVNIVKNRINLSSCGFGVDDFPSTTTSVSQSDIDSVPKHGRSNLLLESETSVKASTGAGAGAGGPYAPHKTENTSRHQPSKKCRLIVKFGGNSGRSLVDDIASTSTPISESMASKVCPVCKTFSSSSNTTLNAHIDQCLVVETTPKWTEDPKTTKSKVKPRRIRLMLEIYKTAPRCTLEELDRRNGRTWATDLSLPMEEIDKNGASKDGKRERVTQLHVQKCVNAGEVGPVYIDASGTKVRILSKLNDNTPVARVAESGGGKRLLKGGTGSKYMAMKKRKHKHNKYLKLAAQSKKFFSQKTRGSQLRGNQERVAGVGKTSDKEPLVYRQITSGNSGNLRPWVCSKPRGSPKKINNQEGQQPVKSQWHLPHSLLGESDQSFLGDSSEESTDIQKFTNLSENQTTTPGSHERVEKRFNTAHVNNEKQCSPVRKKRGRPLSRPVVSDDVGKSFNSMKQNVVHLNRDDMIRRDRLLKPPNASKNQMDSLNKQTVGSEKTSSDHKSGHTRYARTPCSSQETLSKAMRFPSSQKRELSVSYRSSSVTEARSIKIKKSSNFKEPQVNVIDEREDELVGNYEFERQYDLMHNHRAAQLESDLITEELPDMGEPRKIRGMLCNSQWKGSLESASHSYDCLDEMNIGPSGVENAACLREDGFDSARELVHGVDTDHVSLSKTRDGRHDASLRISMDTAFYAVKDASDPQFTTFQTVEDYRGLLSGSESPTYSAEPDFVNDHEMFSADDITNVMIGQKTETGVELDSETAHRDSFPEIDPIPIPGPPGSFLPSPRDMGSEDYHGNSSVTTSRAQSSLDMGNVVDRDSSNSPISAASSISNSTAHGCGFDSASSATLAPNGLESKRSGTADVASAQPFEKNGNGVPESAIIDRCKPSVDEEHLILDRNRMEKGSFAVRNDEPCCCQRKERLATGFVLNQQDSLLLRRRKMVLATDPPIGKPKDHSPNAMSSTLDMGADYSSSPSTCPTSGAENVGFPVIKPRVVPSYDPLNAGVRVLEGMYCDSSSSPSTSNPVLRLMGKNLMVVSNDEDASKPLLHKPSHPQHNSQTCQFPMFTTVSPRNLQNQESRSFQHMVPLHFRSNPHAVSPYFNVGMANSSGCHLESNFLQPQGMFQPRCGEEGFTTPMDPRHEFKGSSSSRGAKEIIVINDAPERETAMTNKAIQYSEGGRPNDHLISSGIFLQGVPSYHQNHLHVPSPCYPSLQDRSNSSGLHLLPATRQLNASNNGRWAGSGMLSQTPSTPASLASSSIVHSSALYYSPSFS